MVRAVCSGIMSRVSRKSVIYSALVGALAPLFIGFGIADGSPLPSFVSHFLWGVPGFYSNLLLGGGGVFAIGPLGLFVFLGISALWYVLLINGIRIIFLICLRR